MGVRELAAALSRTRAERAVPVRTYLEHTNTLKFSGLQVQLGWLGYFWGNGNERNRRMVRSMACPLCSDAGLEMARTHRLAVGAATNGVVATATERLQGETGRAALACVGTRELVLVDTATAGRPDPPCAHNLVRHNLHVCQVGCHSGGDGGVGRFVLIGAAVNLGAGRAALAGEAKRVNHQSGPTKHRRPRRGDVEPTVNFSEGSFSR